MDLLESMAQAAKGMRAQSVRMRVISENLANADTAAKSPEDDPYQRKTVSFKNTLNRATGDMEVSATPTKGEGKDFVLKYDPSHPSADKNGYVKMPNINTLIEMMDMKEAQRSYEANLGVIEVARSMLMRTLDALNR